MTLTPAQIIAMGRPKDEVIRDLDILTKEIEEAKKIMVRMDAERRSLKEVIDRMRETWTPNDPNDEEAKKIKSGGEPYILALKTIIGKKSIDKEFVKQSSLKMERKIRKPVQEQLDRERRRMDMENEIRFGKLPWFVR